MRQHEAVALCEVCAAGAALTSGAPVRQHEAVALCEVCAAGAAAAFLRVTVIEHGKALIAEPPLCLGGRRARNVMRQTEVMTGAALSTVAVATAARPAHLRERDGPLPRTDH